MRMLQIPSDQDHDVDRMAEIGLNIDRIGC